MYKLLIPFVCFLMFDDEAFLLKTTVILIISGGGSGHQDSTVSGGSCVEVAELRRSKYQCNSCKYYQIL